MAGRGLPPSGLSLHQHDGKMGDMLAKGWDKLTLKYKKREGNKVC